MQRFDVAIVGAGPAGSWAARRLARGGARVAIFDATHPREKPCGGGVTSRALDVVGPCVQRLSHTAPSTAAFEDDRAIARVALRTAGLSSASSMVVVSRSDFDRALLDAAQKEGAEHVAERVTNVDVRTDGVLISTAACVHRADMLIGADGTNSLVRRRLSRPFARRQLSIAAGVFVHDVSDDAIVIRCVGDPPGYIWSFPRADHLAVGICAQADVTGPGPLKAAVSRWLDASPCVPAAARDAGRTTYAWPIPSLAPRDFDTQRVAGDRWMLVGDAAGLVDPITREGIYFALKSADYAADTLLTRSAPYERTIARHIYPELKRAALLKRRFFTSGFSSLMVGALARTASIRRVMLDLIEGRQPYVGLGRRLLRTGELRLALQLLGRAV